MTATILAVDDEPDLHELVLRKIPQSSREGTLRFISALDRL
ncbi:hypothetical protein Q3C01_39295 [Bradyrhizobium sp. UFLA05-109]